MALLVVAALLKTSPISDFQNSAPTNFTPLHYHHHLQSEHLGRLFLHLSNILNRMVTSICPPVSWLWSYRRNAQNSQNLLNKLHPPQGGCPCGKIPMHDPSPSRFKPPRPGSDTGIVRFIGPGSCSDSSYLKRDRVRTWHESDPTNVVRISCWSRVTRDLCVKRDICITISIRINFPLHKLQPQLYNWHVRYNGAYYITRGCCWRGEDAVGVGGCRGQCHRWSHTAEDAQVSRVSVECRTPSESELPRGRRCRGGLAPLARMPMLSLLLAFAKDSVGREEELRIKIYDT